MKTLRLDPRSKLFILLMTIIVATASHNMNFVLVLVMMIAILGILLGRAKRSIIYAFIFVLMYLLNVFYIREHAGSFYTMFTAWLSLVYQLYPCCMLSGIIISTTKISEFMSALQRMYVPRSFIITFSVFLRYLPVIREDWSFIKDSMKMRDVSLSVKGIVIHPKRTVTCLYVPLLIAASKAAEELSMACVTRGIENPIRRTSCNDIKITAADCIVMAVFLLFTALSILCRVFPAFAF